MEVRDYITKIGENKKPEDMQKLGDMLAELIDMTEDSHPEIFKDYSKCLYEMAYGKVLTREMAEEIVSKMEPYGEYWNFETTSSVKAQSGIKDISDVDFYVVMNKSYNDNKDTIERFVPEENRVSAYISLTKDFVGDIDAKDGKVYTYFMVIPK